MEETNAAQLARKVRLQIGLNGSLSKTVGDELIRSALTGKAVPPMSLKHYRRSLIYRNQLPLTSHAELWSLFESLPDAKRLELGSIRDFRQMLELATKLNESQALLRIEMDQLMETGEYHTVRDALVALKTSGQVGEGVLKKTARQLIGKFLGKQPMAEIVSMSELFELSPEMGDNVGSYAGMYAAKGLGGEITRLEGNLIKHKQYNQLKQLHLSAFSAYAETGNVDEVRASAAKTLSRDRAKEDIISMFRITQEHGLPRDIRAEILRTALENNNSLFRVYADAPDPVSKVSTMLLELCLEAQREGMAEFNAMYNLAFESMKSDRMSSRGTHFALSAAIDAYVLQEQKTLNINVENVLPCLLSRMNRRVDEGEGLNFFMKRFESDIDYLNRFRAASTDKSLDFLAELNLTGDEYAPLFTFVDSMSPVRFELEMAKRDGAAREILRGIYESRDKADADIEANTGRALLENILKADLLEPPSNRLINETVASLIDLFKFYKEKGYTLSPALFAPVNFIVRKLLDNGHDEEVMPFIVKLLEQADAVGIFHPLKLGKLLWYATEDLNPNAKSVQRLMHDYPELVKVTIPDTFPTQREIQLLKNANLTAKTQATIVLGSPERAFNLAMADKRRFLDFVDGFKPVLEDVAVQSSLKLKSPAMMEQLLTADIDSQTQLALFTTHNGIFKMMSDQRHVLKLYLSYLNVMIKKNGDIDNIIAVWQALHSYLYKVSCAAKKHSLNQLKYEATHKIYGHKSNDKWLNRENIEHESNFFADESIQKLVERFIVNRFATEVDLDKQKKIVEQLRTPLAIKQMCLAMFLMTKERDSLAKYFHGLRTQTDLSYSIQFDLEKREERLALIQTISQAQQAEESNKKFA